MTRLFVMLALVLTVAFPCAVYGAPGGADLATDARAETKFTASPRERFVFFAWASGAATKTTGAQEEMLRIWSRLRLAEIDAQIKKPAKGRTDATTDDFPDVQAPFVAARDEVEAIVKMITPTDERPMSNAASLILGPMRLRLAKLVR